VGGAFTSIGGQARRHLAALDAETGLATAWNPPLEGASEDLFLINSLLVSGKNLLLAWTTATNGGGLSGHCAAFDARTGERKAWPSDQGAYFTAVAGNTVYLSQGFDRIAGQPRKGLAALDLDTGRLTDWDPNNLAVNPRFKGLGSMVIDGDFMYLPGCSCDPPPCRCDEMATIDLATGRALPWKSEPAGYEIYPTLVSGPNLFVMRTCTAFLRPRRRASSTR
jgi:hypothetical protein